MIKVSRETWENLVELKTKLGFRSFDETIHTLIEYFLIKGGLKVYKRE